MNNRRTQIALGLLVAALAIVSIFVLFATAFGASDSVGYPSSFGNCFKVMFGTSAVENVPLLIVAFILQIVAAAFAILGAIFPSKIGGGILGFASILLIGAGVLWALAPTLFLSRNPPAQNVVENVVHGTGTILAMVFTFLPGVLGLYAAYRTFKA